MDEALIVKESPLVNHDTTSLEANIANAEKYLALQDRIRKMAIRLTSPIDWIDEGGKPYLQWTGTSKIAAAFGVSYDSPVFEKELIKDDKGEYVVFHCASTVRWNNRSIPEVGTGSSRDEFFGKKGGHWLPLSEVDQTDLKKKALTNMLNRGMKSLLGLSFTWDEIKGETDGAIAKEKAASVKFDKTNELSQEAKDKRQELGRMILDLCANNPETAKEKLKNMTTFTGKDGKEVSGRTDLKMLSEKQIHNLYPKVKGEWETFCNSPEAKGEMQGA